MQLEPEFLTLRNEAEVLTPFHTAYRYPDGDNLFPEKQVLDDAIIKARLVLKFVHEKINP